MIDDPVPPPEVPEDGPAWQGRDHEVRRLAPRRDGGWRYTDSKAVMFEGTVFQTVPVFTRLWEELHCLGFYGLGIGYEISALSEGAIPNGMPTHCTRCPVSQECWTRHRGRVTALVPDVAAAFDEVADAHAGDPAAMFAAWADVVGERSPDPYSMVMGGNLQDGAHIAIAGAPPDRGPFTLPWPLNDDSGDEDGQ